MSAMSNDADRKPDASGDLSRYPWPRLLFYLFRKNFTGQARMSLPGQWDGVIYCREGSVVRADIPVSQDVLGRILLEKGVIDEATLNESLQKLAKGEGKQGALLKAMGAVDDAQLEDGLRVQVNRKLMRLFPYTQVTFELYSGDHAYGLKGEDAQVRADPYYVIYHGVRNFYDGARLKPEMAKLEDAAIKLVPAFGATKPRFVMGQEEEGLVTLLTRDTLPVDEVRRVSNMGALETDMVLYALWVTEMFEVISAESARAARMAAAKVTPPVIMGDGYQSAGDAVLVAPPPGDDGDDDMVLPMAKTAPAAASGRGHSSNDIRPVVVDEEEDDLPDSIMAAANVDSRTSLVGKGKAANALRREIIEKFDGLDEATHYVVLGVTQDAEADQIREAYFQLAKVFHPDRASALGLRDVVDKAEEIFTRVSEAHNVLSDDSSRTEYNEKLEGKDTRSDVLNAVEAEFIFQKGVFHFRKKDYKSALRYFEEAYKLNAKEGEHLAYMAWSIYSDPSRDRMRTWDTVMDQMEKALTISPNSATCHYFMGELFAAKGDDRKALEYFDKTLEINPEHLEAERHFRLIKIRADKRKATKEKGKGLFHRMFAKPEEEDPKKKKGTKGTKKKRW